jgi:DNA-directed RNA polymerase subunit RPC12/RpoP
MEEMRELRVTMVESSLHDFELLATNYGAAAEELRKQAFEILYESQTSVLTLFQQELYEKIISRAPKKIAALVDPIVLAFSIRDACDLSKADYVWLDLEGNDEIANSAWVRKENQEEIITIALRLLERNLEKYILDTYDRRTRNDMVSVWEAQLNINGCPVCGKSLKRDPITLGGKKIRGWVCTNCGHHVLVQSDTIDYLLTKD